MNRSTIPNMLTIARIVLIPIIVISFYVPWKITNLVVALLFMVASMTDFFDGYLARRYKAQTKFGACFDPIADKLTVIVSLLMIISCDSSPLILLPALIIICREILISGLREFLGTLGVVMPVTRLAKYKTAFQMFAITGLLLASKNSSYTYETLMEYFEVEPFVRIFFNGFVENISIVLLNVAAVLSVITGYGYLRVAMKNMK